MEMKVGDIEVLQCSYLKKKDIYAVALERKYALENIYREAGVIMSKGSNGYYKLWPISENTKGLTYNRLFLKIKRVK